MAHPIHDPRYQRMAKMLAELRQARGMLQTDLADRLQRPQAYVSRYETGNRRLDVVEFFDVLRALDVEPREAADRLYKIFKDEV